jgi:hypothetical protein
MRYDFNVGNCASALTSNISCEKLRRIGPYHHTPGHVRPIYFKSRNDDGMYKSCFEKLVEPL